MKGEAWRRYETAAIQILNEVRHLMGLQAVGGPRIIGGHNTTWSIDAKGIRESDGALVVIEFRRHLNRKLTQEAVGGFAYRIKDLGAAGGIIVSPLGLQTGAASIAAAEDIVSVRLSADSTPESFTLAFLNQLVIRPASASLALVGGRPSVLITKRGPAAPETTAAEENGIPTDHIKRRGC